MMDRTRFGRWVVLACIGAVAACSTQETTGEGDRGTEVIAVVNGTGEITEILACVQCTGDPEVIFSTPVQNDAEFCTPLEFVEGDDPQIWHMFMDTSGKCTIELTGKSSEGEPLCYSIGTTPFIEGGSTEKFAMDFNCNVAAQGLGGNLDLDATRVETVDNICFQYYSLELSPSMIPIPEVGDDADTMVYVRAHDPDGKCGTDPTNTDPGGGQISTCDVSPDPERVVIRCIANILNQDGSLGPETGTWSDPDDHDGDGDPRTFNGEDDSNGIFTCTDPGVDFRITCGGNEGDLDCTKIETHDGSCPPPTYDYDLSNSIFKRYTGFLPVNTITGVCEGGDEDGGGLQNGRCNSDVDCPGSPPGVCIRGQGAADTDCFVPDLSRNPGAMLRLIETKCLIITPPEISGSISFEKTGGNVFNVTARQDVSFVLDVPVVVGTSTIQVVITTDVVTTFTGTGTGTVPGTITLDRVDDRFNMNAALAGNVNCAVTNLTTGEDVSSNVCPLINLKPGDNPLPFPEDPGARTLPQINVTETTFQLGDGPTNANGWFNAFPPPLRNSGTQWIALAGDRIN